MADPTLLLPLAVPADVAQRMVRDPNDPNLRAYLECGEDDAVRFSRVPEDDQPHRRTGEIVQMLNGGQDGMRRGFVVGFEDPLRVGKSVARMLGWLGFDSALVVVNGRRSDWAMPASVKTS